MARAERISSVVLVVFGVFVAAYSRHYLKLGLMISPDAGFLPYGIGIALAALGAIWFVASFKVGAAREAGVAEGGAGEAGAESAPDRALLISKMLPGVLIIILYAWLFERAGYLLSTVLFMVGWQKIVEREGWLKTSVIALLSAAAMYTLFVYLLRVYLPTGTWFS
ncbi:MAG: tripartite tricarboxylate transporter TctB family protein [Desulfobacteria bacterium]